MDIVKAFDSVDHNFSISPLEKYDFGKNFVSWLKILLRNQESCVLNGGTTSIKYFQFFFNFLALEILFHLTK